MLSGVAGSLIDGGDHHLKVGAIRSQAGGQDQGLSGMVCPAGGIRAHADGLERLTDAVREATVDGPKRDRVADAKGPEMGERSAIGPVMPEDDDHPGLARNLGRGVVSRSFLKVGTRRTIDDRFV